MASPRGCPSAGLGIVYSGSNFGGFIGSTVAGILLVSVGWRDAYLWIGLATTLLLMPIVALTVREPEGAPEPGGGEGEAEGVAAPGAEAEGMPLRAALRTREFWLLWVALFLFYAYFIGANAHLTLYLTDLGLSAVDVALNYGLMVGIGVFAKIGIGGLIGPVALGYMHDALGDYQLAFQLLFGATVLSFALLAVLRPLAAQPLAAPEKAT